MEETIVFQYFYKSCMGKVIKLTIITYSTFEETGIGW